MRRVEGIALGSRVVPPEEWQQWYQGVASAIEMLYTVGSLPLTKSEKALASGTRHQLLELREAMRDAQREFAASMRELTR